MDIKIEKFNFGFGITVSPTSEKEKAFIKQWEEDGMYVEKYVDKLEHIKLLL